MTTQYMWSALNTESTISMRSINRECDRLTVNSLAQTFKILGFAIVCSSTQKTSRWVCSAQTVPILWFHFPFCGHWGWPRTFLSSKADSWHHTSCSFRDRYLFFIYADIDLYQIKALSLFTAVIFVSFCMQLAELLTVDSTFGTQLKGAGWLASVWIRCGLCANLKRAEEG